VLYQGIIAVLCIAALSLRKLPALEVLIQLAKKRGRGVLQSTVLARVIRLILKLWVNRHTDVPYKVFIASPMSVQSRAAKVE
jgi:hypothetical protein